MSAEDGSFNDLVENVRATRTGFSNPDVYTICVRAEDESGRVSNPGCALLAVYDPSAGFVTGGGWYTSRPGAYLADTSVAGRANFGFVSRYQKGAKVPTGNTEFQFKAGNLNFKSSSYEWLVVQDAAGRAQYKGVGTINGTGDYGFLLTLYDAQASNKGGTDMIRIKIWDRNNGDALVYDTALGLALDLSAISDDPSSSPLQAIEGGSIVIHGGK